MTVLAAAAPAALAVPRADERPGRRPWLLPAAAFGLLAALWVGGQARLALAPDRAATDVQLRLVQANVDQSLKWQEDAREAALVRHVQLSRRPGFETADLVIWPEAAATFYIDESAPVRAFVAQAAPPGGLLLTGAPRRTRSAGRTIAFWNSLHALTPAGAIAATYDKHHLVPFGEYVPLRAVLPLPLLAYGAHDHSPGPGPRTLRLPGVPPFSPLICYEAIFPGAAVARGIAPDERPAWLLNITNDAWFGHTAGPYQHFQAARMRAVEEGLPLVRAANTGISAVVDAYGRVVGRLGLGETGVLDAALPPALAGRTPMARLGMWTRRHRAVPRLGGRAGPGPAFSPWSWSAPARGRRARRSGRPSGRIGPGRLPGAREDQSPAATRTQPRRRSRRGRECRRGRGSEPLSPARRHAA